MGCEMIAIKQTGTDCIMTGIDMISFIRKFNQSAEGAGGLGIIRSNKVRETK